MSNSRRAAGLAKREDRRDEKELHEPTSGLTSIRPRSKEDRGEIRSAFMAEAPAAGPAGGA
ncbi:MAG: hypothetical protein ACRD3M_02760 [Thermoanaerobaculia bacterium]